MNDPYDAAASGVDVVHHFVGTCEFVVSACAASDRSPESERSNSANWKLQAQMLAETPSSRALPPSTEQVEAACSPSTSAYSKLATESTVGWSKSVVGDISSSHSADKFWTSFVAAIESRPADINDSCLLTAVPKMKCAALYTVGKTNNRLL